jgi:hypothetical protein
MGRKKRHSPAGQQAHAWSSWGPASLGAGRPAAMGQLADSQTVEIGKVERGLWTRFQDLHMAETRPEAGFHLNTDQPPK